jgi:TfoX/Sxy family transcriptional regulator of competence genes
MALDEKLTAYVRAALADARELVEVRMFGGIGFMLNGNMVAAASDRGLLVRVGKEREADALARPGSSVMVMNGRAMNGYVRVSGSGLDARSVASWLDLARAHVESLPPKSRALPTGTKSKAAARSTAKRKASTKAPAKQRKR